MLEDEEVYKVHDKVVKKSKTHLRKKTTLQEEIKTKN